MIKDELISIENELKALANKRRLAILKYLLKKREANVTEISNIIKLSFKSTSRHLSILRTANIVEKDQRSIEVYYSISTDISPYLKQLLSTV